MVSFECSSKCIRHHQLYNLQIRAKSPQLQLWVTIGKYTLTVLTVSIFVISNPDTSGFEIYNEHLPDNVDFSVVPHSE